MNNDEPNAYFNRIAEFVDRPAWTEGGDWQCINTEEELEQVILSVEEAGTKGRKRCICGVCKRDARYCVAADYVTARYCVAADYITARYCVAADCITARYCVAADYKTARYRVAADY